MGSEEENTHHPFDSILQESRHLFEKADESLQPDSLGSPTLTFSRRGSTASTTSTDFSLRSASILQKRENKGSRYVNRPSALTQTELDCIHQVNRKFSRSEPLLQRLSSDRCVASVAKTPFRRNNVSFGKVMADTTSELSTSEIWENKGKMSSFGNITVDTSSDLFASEIWGSEILEKGKRSSISSNSSADSEFILPLGRWKNSSARRNSERINFKLSSDQRRNSCKSFNSSCSSLGVMPESILSEMRTNISSKENQSFEKSKFDIAVNESITSLEKAKKIIKRQRAVSTLVDRLLLAESEDECYDIVQGVMASLFSVDKCEFALMYDCDHYLIYQTKDNDASLDAPDLFPFHDSLVEECSIRNSIYCSDTTFRHGPEYQRFTEANLHTVLIVPIMVGAHKFAGSMTIALEKIDALTGMDIMLIEDIAISLGIQLFNKRLQSEQETAYNESRELLESIIPVQVLEKVEDKLFMNKDEFDGSNQEIHFNAMENMGILERIILKNNTSTIHTLGKKHLVPQHSSPESQVLYAENESNVSIIFADIVGFSKIACKMHPIQVMQLLQDIYARFDSLCQKHGVRKLETIGDAYIVSGGLLDESNDIDDGKDAAKRCLAMAQDMVREAQNVYAPTEPPERVRIRVGIHVGNLSYGVLGQNVPKFSVYGDAVNIAARMEQTAPINKVHVSEAFHDLVENTDVQWENKKITHIKNIGEQMTWTLNPM
ncbi:hypothetical protein CTEN210_18155 [Chaetoceros tenuissimus]|uniref:Guanylate cyclase domain-containing protein n=1 Tax=Chaetoceros tenuissimus TaxID=426638 RepID=A0AAD3DFG5_9STRA|nr:hypothetical protein CTEN210_18155 [Chaetoceros tenuissimus]